MITSVPSLRDQRILVVEDEYLIAANLCELLENAGAHVVGPVGRVTDALRLIESNKGDLYGAVLDLNLHGERSYPIADALSALGVRVVLVTGYSGDAIPEDYLHFPRCQKPFDVSLLSLLAPIKIN